MMAVVTWSPELRNEVKKFKLFNNNELLKDRFNLSANEQKAVNRVLFDKEDSKEPKNDFWA